MKDKRIMYAIAGFMIFLGLASTYNWFPRPGWKTATATYTSSPEVEYYVGSNIVRGKLSGGGESCGRGSQPRCSTLHFKVQYNPDKPHIVRMAPTAKPIVMSILLTAAGLGLLYFVKKK
jgi:hypothetical protein